MLAMISAAISVAAVATESDADDDAGDFVDDVADEIEVPWRRYRMAKTLTFCVSLGSEDDPRRMNSSSPQ